MKEKILTKTISRAKILKGKRIFLRPPTLEDFIELTTLYKTNLKFHRGRVQPKTSREGFEKYLAQNERAENEFFLICLNENGTIAGTSNLSQIFMGNFRSAYLGYLLGEAYAGKGFMSEAVRLTLSFAFKTLKLHRVEANIQPENIASINVLKRAGFSNEGFSPKYLKINGRWRDHERWAIIVEEWKKSKLNK